MTNRAPAMPDDQLLDYLNGGLDASEARKLEASPGHEAALGHLEELLCSLVDDLPEAEPQATARLRHRLFDTLVDEVRTPKSLVVQLQRLYDLTQERAEAVLRDAHNDADWLPGPVANVEIKFVYTGPRVRGAIATLVRIPAQGLFPDHEHLGEEQGLVLRGSAIDDQGVCYPTGHRWKLPVGSSHHFVGGGQGPCVAAVLAREGVRFRGAP